MATELSRTRLARLLAAAVLGSTAGLAWSQNTPIPAADPAATVPTATYRSAFEGYRPFVDEKVGSWREANETAAQVGGQGGIFGSQGGHAAHGSSGAPASAMGTATATGSATEAAAAAPPPATGGQQTREAARQRVEQERQNTPQSGHQGHQGHQGHGGSGGR